MYAKNPLQYRASDECLGVYVVYFLVQFWWVTAGMERPKDDYKESHNVRLASQDTLFGGQVSRLQVTFQHHTFSGLKSACI